MLGDILNKLVLSHVICNHLFLLKHDSCGPCIDCILS